MEKPHFYFITLFPETIEVWLKSSILGKALDKELFSYSLIQLRDFAQDKHARVDDLSYGGGGGMVLKIEPLVSAVESILEKTPREKTKIIYFSPGGEKLNQDLIEKVENQEQRNFILICGHYEGVDQRFIDHWVDLEISIGDFVLTGGELPALAFTDALIRRLSGALGNPEGHLTESFSLSEKNNRILEYPQFTRPAEFRGLKVPEILLSGDHKKIAAWRIENALKRTLKKRPDLLN